MLIRCPQCSTGFNLPDEKIPAKGAKVKCSACTHTFRVRIEDGEPVFFYKKGEAPRSGETMIGAPIDIEGMGLGQKKTVAAHDSDPDHENTQFGIPQRSKSAREGYNPFPLAGAITAENPAITAEQARNDRTQILGSSSDVEELDDDDVFFEDDDIANERTQLGPQGLAEESLGDRTKIGAPAGRGGSSPLRTTEDDVRDAGGDPDGDHTQMLGSGGIDLFDGAATAPPAQGESVDFDPFGDAFEEPVGDVGLLMPSTPTADEPSQPSSLALETSSEVGISEEDFLLGGGTGSEFGDALSLVDNSFGEDVPSFDAMSGVIDSDKRPKSRRSSSGQSPAMSTDPIELEDLRTDERPREARRTAPRREERPAQTRTDERPRRAERARPAPAYVHQVGATSPIRRTFDIIFITLIVGVAFVGLIAARAGGFVDFTRFGHMVEVAFSGVEFQPREEWKQIVEIPPPDPPPDEPLRVENLRALEHKVGDTTVLIVSGRIRNYSLEVFKGVKIRATVKQGDKKLAERVVTVGQSVDRKKLARAKSVDDLKKALVSKLPDIGKEGKTYFALVFDDVPSDVVASGNYDYSVVVAD